MSEWGSIIDAIETEVRTAVSGIPTSTLGFERGVRPGQSLQTGEFPHVFAHDPVESREELDVGNQVLVRFSVQLDVWTRNETQEQVAVRLDAIESEIRGNPTLGGLVDFAWCSARSVVEAALREKAERAGVVVIQTRKVTR